MVSIVRVGNAALYKRFNAAAPAYLGYIAKIAKVKRYICERTYSQSRPHHFPRLNLRLRRLIKPRPEEHGPETCEAGSEKIHRSRATLRHRVGGRAPGASRGASGGKRRRSQPTERDNCQQPFASCIAACMGAYYKLSRKNFVTRSHNKRCAGGSLTSCPRPGSAMTSTYLPALTKSSVSTSVFE
jgi:hypothetical protein